MWYKRIMKPKRRCVLFLALLLLWIPPLLGCTLSNTPRRSLSELRTALLDHDAEQALRYIDTDSVVDCLVRDIFRNYEKKADNPLGALGLMAARQAASALMPGIKDLVRKQLRDAITSSDEAGYFQDIRRASVWYLNIDVEGDTALVRPRGKSDIRFRMARSDEGRWRIVEIIRK